MALARWSPFDVLDRDANELIRRTFGDFGTSLLGRGTPAAAAWSPALNAYVRDGELHVHVEAPGMSADDFDIEVTDGLLQIRGERRHESTDEQDGFVRREMSYGRFERTVGLPDHIDPEQLRATYEAGILKLAVPLPQKPTSKVKVEVTK